MAEGADGGMGEGAGTGRTPEVRPQEWSPHDDWAAGFESHRRAQVERWLASTPEQRLRWLEEMIVFAHRVGALPRRRGEE